MVEAGIVKHRLTEGLPNAEICPLDLGNKEKQLQNSDLNMTYAIVVVGFSIALLIFIAEQLFVWKAKRAADTSKYWKNKTNESFSRSRKGETKDIKTIEFFNKKDKLFFKNIQSKHDFDEYWNSNKEPNKRKIWKNNENTSYYENKRMEMFERGVDSSIHLFNPPPYNSLFKTPYLNSLNNANGEKQLINGREYYVVKSPSGTTRLVPVRAPSALLFQYNN